MGGMHLFNLGDFLQTPGIGAPVWRPYDPSKPARSASDAEAQKSGTALWQGINVVMELTQNHRIKSTLWLELCERARMGCLTPDDVTILNSRLILPSSPAVVPGTRFVSPGNKARREALAACFETAVLDHDGHLSDDCALTGSQLAAQWKDFGGFLRVLAVPVGASGTGKIDDSVAALIRALPCEKIGSKPGVLDLQLGGPAMCLKNYNPTLGVANGANCVFEDVVFTPSVKVFLTSLSPNHPDVVVPTVYAHHVHHVLLQFAGDSPLADKLPFPSIGVGRFVVKPEQSIRPVKIALANREISVRVLQVPVVSAGSKTSMKIQGQTCPGVAGGGFSGTSPAKAGFLYTVMGRVRRLENFYLTEPLMWNKRKKGGVVSPNVAALAELDRLRTSVVPYAHVNRVMAPFKPVTLTEQLARTSALLNESKRELLSLQNKLSDALAAIALLQQNCASSGLAAAGALARVAAENAERQLAVQARENQALREQLDRVQRERDVEQAAKTRQRAVDDAEYAVQLQVSTVIVSSAEWQRHSHRGYAAFNAEKAEKTAHTKAAKKAKADASASAPAGIVASGSARKGGKGAPPLNSARKSGKSAAASTPLNSVRTSGKGAVVSKRGRTSSASSAPAPQVDSLAVGVVAALTGVAAAVAIRRRAARTPAARPAGIPAGIARVLSRVGTGELAPASVDQASPGVQSSLAGAVGSGSVRVGVSSPTVGSAMASGDPAVRGDRRVRRAEGSVLAERSINVGLSDPSSAGVSRGASAGWADSVSKRQRLQCSVTRSEDSVAGFDHDGSSLDRSAPDRAAAYFGSAAYARAVRERVSDPDSSAPLTYVHPETGLVEFLDWTADEEWALRASTADDTTFSWLFMPLIVYALAGEDAAREMPGWDEVASRVSSDMLARWIEAIRLEFRTRGVELHSLPWHYLPPSGARAFPLAFAYGGRYLHSNVQMALLEPSVFAQGGIQYASQHGHGNLDQLVYAELCQIGYERLNARRELCRQRGLPCGLSPQERDAGRAAYRHIHIYRPAPTD